MVSPAAVRLLTVVGCTYPLGLASRYLFLYPARKTNASTHQTLQHLFHLLSGWGLSYLFMGVDMWRSIASVLLTWLFLQLCPHAFYRNGLAQATVFIGAMGFLLYAYFHHATLDYDLDWTTPQSVLTLRLIAFAFDVADGINAKKGDAPNNALSGTIFCSLTMWRAETRKTTHQLYLD